MVKATVRLTVSVVAFIYQNQNKEQCTCPQEEASPRLWRCPGWEAAQQGAPSKESSSSPGLTSPRTPPPPRTPPLSDHLPRQNCQIRVESYPPRFLAQNAFERLSMAQRSFAAESIQMFSTNHPPPQLSMSEIMFTESSCLFMITTLDVNFKWTCWFKVITKSFGGISDSKVAKIMLGCGKGLGAVCFKMG